MHTVPLYVYIDKNRHLIDKKIFNITGSSNGHRCFYLNVPQELTKLAQKTTTSLWIFDELHASIEEKQDSSHLAMGPHVTLVHRSNADASVCCKTHVYLTRHFKFNGCFQQRVIRKIAGGDEVVLFTENYDGGKPRALADYPGVYLLLDDLKQIASVGVRHVLALDALRVTTYMSLYEELQTMESDISVMLRDKKEGFLAKSRQKLAKLTTRLVELNGYHDGRKFVMDHLIAAHINELEQQEQAVLESGVVDLAIKNKTGDEISSPHVQMVDSVKPSIEVERAAVELQMQQDIIDDAKR